MGSLAPLAIQPWGRQCGCSVRPSAQAKQVLEAGRRLKGSLCPVRKEAGEVLHSWHFPCWLCLPHPPLQESDSQGKNVLTIHDVFAPMSISSWL